MRVCEKRKVKFESEQRGKWHVPFYLPPAPSSLSPVFFVIKRYEGKRPFKWKCDPFQWTQGSRNMYSYLKEKCLFEGASSWWETRFINKFTRRVNRIPKQPSPTQSMTNVQQLENEEYFTYLGSLLKTDANLLVKWNPGLPRQKQKDSFHQKTGLKIFKKELRCI